MFVEFKLFAVLMGKPLHFRLEESGISLAPPSKLIFWFLKNNSVAKSTEKEKGTKSHFKPTILRSFYPQDDNSILKNSEKADTSIPRLLLRTDYNRHDSSTAYSLPNFYVLTLAHIRLIFFILDCFLIVFRFYNTYVVLKEILIGKSVIIDASSYLTTVTLSSKNAIGSDGAGKLATNRDGENYIDGGMYKEIGDSCPFSNEAYLRAVQEDAFYYCRHQCSPKMQVRGNIC
ncbi:unnamed protein product [Dibothriocephalus latus]|uniref:Uncharacterized protein n=1 Tax=Dibothriocephalus latus TaxID=60516 RepID=A0A3P6QHK8_DIBLA|nr:unnamed protein product [Dibothriocephalus latus]